MTAGLAPSDPFTWWRTPGFATDRIALCGDLDTARTERGRRQLDEWLALGITDVLDVRDEWSDEEFVRRHAPDVAYHWVGTDDDGRTRPDEWFEAGVAAATKALSDPDRRVMVHCHMGVNRGPSMAYAVMLAHGFDAIEALDAIRAARPIAAIIYADDAVSWWCRTNGVSPSAIDEDVRRVKRWLRANHVDDNWVASRIRRADGTA